MKAEDFNFIFKLLGIGAAWCLGVCFVGLFLSMRSEDIKLFVEVFGASTLAVCSAYGALCSALRIKEKLSGNGRGK